MSQVPVYDMAYFLLDEPVFIIMEYALHGNLKEYLNLCRESVLQSGQPLTISHADAGKSMHVSHHHVSVCMP